MKIFKKILLCLLVFLIALAGFFSIGSAPKTEITWGANFSKLHAEKLGFNWKEVYSAILDDLEVKHLKLATYWDLIEKEEGIYDFEDLDWQLKEAEKRGVDILLVVGMKTPRWPECRFPVWAENLTKEQQQEKIKVFVSEAVSRYKDRDLIWAWQVENEPLFPFGKCPWRDKEFLKEEIDLVKSLDPQNRPIIISDSGESSFWFAAAGLADIVGTTLYRKVWFKEIGSYVSYPFNPTFYWRKASIIKKLFGKEVICIELQAEPWGPSLIYEISLEEQLKTMDFERFKKNIEFAEKTGLDTFYLWGAEWWYWMKEKENRPEIWNEAKNLF